MKPLLIKGQVVELTCEECIKQFEPFNSKMKQQFRLIGLENDDLEQEINIGIFHAYTSYDINRNIQFITLLYKVVRQHLLKIKRNKNILKRKSNLNTKSLHETYGHDDNSELIDIIENKNDFTNFVEIKSLLNNLGPQEKQIIFLSYQGYSQDEIGKIIGCSQVEVSRLKRKSADILKEVS